MSHSFYIHDVADASLAATLAALPFDDLVTEPEAPQAGWPELVHIYQDNQSVRSIETALENNTLQVRIMAHSAPADFKLAAAIVEQVASTFDRPIEPEDNASMPLEQWRAEYGPEWQQDQCKTYLNMMISMYQRQQGASLTMFGTRAQFEVGPRLMEPLLENPKTFARNFFDAFRRRNYIDREDVFHASVMVVGNEATQQQARISTVGQDIPTCVSTSARFLALNNADYSSPAGDAQFIVPFDDFAREAAAAVTWLGDDLMLTPVFESPQWEDLLEQLRPLAVTDMFARDDLLSDPEPVEETTSATTSNDNSFGFDNDQWGAIVSMPIAVFLMVAGADGEIDDKEVAAFQEQLLLSMVNESQVLREAIAGCLPVVNELLSKLVQAGAENVAMVLAMGRQTVAEKVGEEQANTLSTALYAMGEKIAKASGGRLFGFGSKIGKEEKVMLAGIKKLLQLNGE